MKRKYLIGLAVIVMLSKAYYEADLKENVSTIGSISTSLRALEYMSDKIKEYIGSDPNYIATGIFPETL